MTEKSAGSLNIVISPQDLERGRAVFLSRLQAKLTDPSKFVQGAAGRLLAMYQANPEHLDKEVSFQLHINRNDLLGFSVSTENSAVASQKPKVESKQRKAIPLQEEKIGPEEEWIINLLDREGDIQDREELIRKISGRK